MSWNAKGDAPWSARRWKSARTGVESLRALQAAREASEAEQALYIALAPLSEQAQPYAAAQKMEVWHAEELALALRDVPMGKASKAK